jgi:hypothetical protein
MLVSMFRIVRTEELGQLPTRMFDELTDRPQSRKNDQVSAVYFLPQFCR